ncbi:TRI56-like protein [Mya arenaria]|uniref:TRI56-like protein n=1 Tax=Mya arenaria TaxID=6604 RepID=A0ABY7G1Y1_MYAAR|nr:TRI56-like protein [Mya arenaria]
MAYSPSENSRRGAFSQRRTPRLNRSIPGVPRRVRFQRSPEATDPVLVKSRTFVKDSSEPEAPMIRAEDVKEEFLVCSICTHEYDEESHVPRVLPCLHTFCQTCLKKIVRGTRLECPLCKQGHELPKGTIFGLAKDTTRRNLIDFIKVRKRSSEILCKDCPEDQTAKDFCKECYIFMCPECTKAHKRSLASRKHSVLTIKQLQNSGLDVFRRKIVCTKNGHEGQQLAFYCTKTGCETSICTACTVCDHERSNGHTIINVQDLYKLKKNELEKLFASLDSDMSSAKFILQQTEQELLNIDIKELEIEKDIDDVFEKFQKVLAKRQRQLKEELSAVCEKKKSDIQRHVESLENYLDSASNAKDFSYHVINHTDPTELTDRCCTSKVQCSTTNDSNQNSRCFAEPWVPYRRWSSRSGCPSLEATLTLGFPPHPLSVNMTTTDGPHFTYDRDTVHQYREISESDVILRNYSTVQKSQGMVPGGRRLKKYRGVLGNRAFHAPGKFYFEVRIMYNIVRPLDNINFVFEVGVSRRGDVDHNYYIYDQPNAWSFCGQHCDDHKQVCAWCRHHGYNLAHMPLSLNTAGTVLDRKFGFLLDSDRRQLTVFDVTRNRKVHSFTDVDFSSGLWPVFGCHWPSKVKLEMILRTGKDIESIADVVDRQVLHIESPVFDNKRLESEFQK